MTLLVADIGGTNSRCAVFTEAGPAGDVASFRNAEFGGVAQLLRHYVGQLPAALRPGAAALAVAAPIRGDDVRMINIDWSFSRQRLRQDLGVADLHVINDFAALAWSLPVLTPGDLHAVGGGEPVAAGPKVVLGPGTGLGVASLVPCGGIWQAIPGEGGHVTLAAQDEQEEAVIRQARERFGHCSAERLLSGAGLGFLHQALHGGPELAADDIGGRFAEGEAASAATLELFFRLLGNVAGNVALTLGAFGGVYIGGGIVPRYISAFAASGFRASFEAKGRYRDYLRAIPTWVITAAHPALYGLAAFARSSRAMAS